MVNMLHREIRANDGFGVSKMVLWGSNKKRGTQPTKFEDVEDDLQTKKQLAEQSGVTQ